MSVVQSIRQQALDNKYYRHVLDTGPNTQIVIMSIPLGSDIGEETHPDNDQILFLIEGIGKAVLDGREYPFESGDAVLVPAGTRHNFFATNHDLKIITVYSPPHHPNGIIHKTKKEAETQGN